jgi:hypothetical protein
MNPVQTKSAIAMEPRSAIASDDADQPQSGLVPSPNHGNIRAVCFIHILKTGGSSLWRMMIEAGADNYRVADTYHLANLRFNNVTDDVKALGLILEDAGRENSDKPLLIHHHTLSCPGNLHDFQYVLSTRDPVARCFSEYRHHCLLANQEMTTETGGWFDAIGSYGAPSSSSATAYFSRFKQGLGIYRRHIYSLHTGRDCTNRSLPGLFASIADPKLRKFIREKIVAVVDLADFRHARRLAATVRRLNLGAMRPMHFADSRTQRGSMAQETVKPGEWLTLFFLTLPDRLFLMYLWVLVQLPRRPKGLARRAPTANRASGKDPIAAAQPRGRMVLGDGAGQGV